MKAGEEDGGRPSAGEGAPVSWFEIMGPDPDALVSFYSSVFGWTRREGGDSSYSLIDTGSAGRGISGGIGISSAGTGHVNVYASVSALAPWCERAAASGGSVSHPPTTLADEIEFAHLRDPDGNTFGIYRRLG